MKRRLVVNFLVWLLLVCVLPSLNAATKSTNVRVGLPGRLSSNGPLYVAADRGFFAHALKAGRVHGTLLIQPTDSGLVDEGFRSMGFVGDLLKDCEYVGYVVNGDWAKSPLFCALELCCLIERKNLRT